MKIQKDWLFVVYWFDKNLGWKNYFIRMRLLWSHFQVYDRIPESGAFYHPEETWQSRFKKSNFFAFNHFSHWKSSLNWNYANVLIPIRFVGWHGWIYFYIKSGIWIWSINHVTSSFFTSDHDQSTILFQIPFKGRQAHYALSLADCLFKILLESWIFLIGRYIAIKFIYR